ncbi:MAG: hypothetical protein ACKOXF_08690 [Chitinophagaceae bacterium]
MKIAKILLITFSILNEAEARDTLKVLFVYGSRPASKGEDKWFGGLHGGHVSISYQKGFVSFVPKVGIQIFKRKKINSKFTLEYGDYFVFDTIDSRYLIISIPIDSLARIRLDSVINRYLIESPYPYAFFGMRCASAAADLMQKSSIISTKERKPLWRKYFYPRLLRRELIKMARQNAWPMYYRPGRSSRRWEKDFLQPN